MAFPLFCEALSLVLALPAEFGSSSALRQSLFTWLCYPYHTFLSAIDTVMELIYLFFWLSLAFAQNPVVDLGYASYEGRSLPNGVSQWLGMRFAAAPIGDLRFAAPQDPPTQQGVQKANNVGVVLCAEIVPN